MAVDVSYRNVVKRYAGQDEPAVRDLSLEVPAGEICVLVGPSGCGKTTAMRMVNRTVTITEFIASQSAVDEAGPDFQSTVETVQEGLTLEVMQELNARVDIDKEEPAAVATQYLQESGYIE